MIVFGLKTCDACRKAKAALPGAALRDIRERPLSEDEIARFLAALGPKLVNRRSTTWRGLAEAERAEDPAMLLARHPALMKRPVIEAGGRLFLGWDAATRAALLGKAGQDG